MKNRRFGLFVFGIPCFAAAFLFCPGPGFSLGRPQGDAPKAAAPGTEAASPAEDAAGGPAQASQGVSPETAFALAAGEAEKGDGGAMVTLGSFYEQGVGVTRSFIKALEWYQKAADMGVPEGWYNVGICYEIGMGTAGDAARALSSFERAAGMGLVEAMEKLSSMYFTGTGAPRNESRGLAYLAQAADAGGASAANSLGVIYLQGLAGQQPDPKRAHDYFVRSADRGNLEAIKNLGVVYRDGLGAAKDPAQALKWFTIASKGGYQAVDMEQILKDLRSGLSPGQIKNVEDSADQWIEDYRRRAGAP